MFDRKSASSQDSLALFRDEIDLQRSLTSTVYFGHLCVLFSEVAIMTMFVTVPQAS
jgi:hypothetical protein